MYLSKCDNDLLMEWPFHSSFLLLFIPTHTHTHIQARPPGIYKEHYLRDLAQRYTEGDMGDIQVPALPDWCHDEEEADSGGEGGGEGEMRQVNDRKKAKKEIDNEVCGRCEVEL